MGYVHRQAALLLEVIESYRNREVGLGFVVKRLEALMDAVPADGWRAELFQAVLVLEQIHAFSVTEKKNLTDTDQLKVAEVLSDLESFAAKSLHASDFDSPT